MPRHVKRLPTADLLTHLEAVETETGIDVSELEYAEILPEGATPLSIIRNKQDIQLHIYHRQSNVVDKKAQGNWII